MREPERFEVNQTTVKELKIKIQKDVTTYLTYSLPLCGILWDERQYQWFYSHFFQLYTLWGKGDNFWLDYLEGRDFYKDVAEYSILDSEYLKDEANVIGFLEEKISSGYYVIIFIDEYYLPNNPNYQREHYLHQRLVYGYDRTNQEIKAIAFDNMRNFTNMISSYDDFRKAYELGKSYYDVSEPWVIKENVELIKPKYDDVSFSWPALLANLNDYLSGKGELSQIRPMNIEVIGDQAVYNINVIDRYMRSFIYESGNFRFIYLLAEHKEIMYRRLRFFADNFSVGKDLTGLLEQYHQIGRRFIIARNLYLKEMTKEIFENDKSGNRETTGKIFDILKWGKNEECLVLEEIYRILSSV